MQKVNIVSVPADLKKGLEFVSRAGIFSADSSSKFKIKFTPGSGLIVKPFPGGAEIIYSRLCQAFRGLGIILGKLSSRKKITALSETQRFELINVMLDVSRNAAPRLSVLKDLLIRMSLMGINSLMLYTEANYEIKGEKLFGYNIGRYSSKELSELDYFAACLGIEMIPCIQTLAHLRRLLQWDQYRNIKDTETVLMVGETSTYDFIEKMIAAAHAPFTSKRIHIGMDEAWDLGLGNYLKKNGYASPHSLMADHLPRVMEIIRRHNLKPMMWADMYFRAGSKTGDYYDLNAVIPDDVIKSIPDDISLVYWDYYHCDPDFYRTFIEKHRALSPHIMVAPGVHSWNRFFPAYQGALDTMIPALRSAKEKNIREIIMTVWGDDGNEYPLPAIFPLLQYYAEEAYNNKADKTALAENLLGSCSMNYHDWFLAGNIDEVNGLRSPGRHETCPNTSKILLWEDPLYGIMQPHFLGINIKGHYQELCRELKKTKKGHYTEALFLITLLAEFLSRKADFPAFLRQAYKNKNRSLLRKILKKDIPWLKSKAKKLWQSHRSLWHDINQPFGWETIEARYGTLFFRLCTLEKKLSDYLAGKSLLIEELENDALPVFPLAKNEMPICQYKKCAGAVFDSY
ncbi:MAG: hypothetical protein A2096_00445 [Spirochaetes bacterium GWF1_41_5]|nr:MAG: hypothetical protein A2096_00445 [Spirochaetes bacterium GWF1_41_5]HBE03613.1 beta-N-acetylhexosaminidase [Spirochaetia bacterium]